MKHKHKCPNQSCNYIWEHEDECADLQSEAEATLAHTCPKCGREQWFKYWGHEYGVFHSCLRYAKETVTVG